jgi:cobalamin transport system substrate-binding protein
VSIVSLKRFMTRCDLLCALCILLFFVGCRGNGATEDPQARATHKTPTRVASLVPAATEMLYAMHAEKRLVGVSSYDRFPPDVNQLPKLGGLLDPSVERLLALRPDLVIAYDTQADLKERLARAAIPVFPYVHRDLADVTRTLRALGERLDVKSEADAAATRLEEQISGISARVARQPAVRTLLVIARDAGALSRVQASGGYGFLHDLLEAAGGSDVLADIPRESVQMSTEMIIARAPDVILELHYGDSIGSLELETERRVWNALPSVPAVKNNRVHLLVGDEFVVPGPRIVLAEERFARTLHPEAFK